MTVANKAFVALAATALAMAIDAEAVSPITEQLLNDVDVSTFDAAEVTERGKVVVLVTTAGVIRPVADSNGNVKLFASADAAVALAKRSNLPPGTPMRFVKIAKGQSAGDPVAALKTKHKAAKTEAGTALAAKSKVTQKVAAATSLGWNSAPTGSPEALEYSDLQMREVTLGEWVTNADQRVVTLTAALVGAGIDPVTYLPKP